MNAEWWVIGCALFAAWAPMAMEVPDVLTTREGKKVTTKAEWEQTRRPEVLELFKTHVYGRNPVERPESLRFEEVSPDRVMMDGKALRKRVNILYTGPGGEGSIELTAFIPSAATTSKQVPAFVLICNRKPEENIDPERVTKSPFWPAEEVVERGYAALAFFNGDVAPDVRDDSFTNGVHAVFQPDPTVRKPDSWGTLAAWAWGASRVMDWIEQEPLINSGQVAVIGHSRGGKTALWAGAMDQRFALTISNNSGCGGAKFNRMELPKSEHIARINRVFPHWFCLNFREFSDNEYALPLDMHMLVALMAPRLVYVASATEDHWAGQPAEFHSCLLGSSVWSLYDLKGMTVTAQPAPDTPAQDGCVGYHLRTGKHDLTLYDWERYMDFFDRHR